MRVFLLCALFTAQQSFAGCYVIENLTGYSVREYSDFEMTKDGFSGQEFQVNLDGHDSFIENSAGEVDEMDCWQLAESNTVICTGKNDGGEKALVETWTVYPSAAKLVHTKASNGFLADGANMFTGDITGRCD